MYFNEFFIQDDMRHSAHLLISEVNLDELDKNSVEILLKPYYDDVEIVRETYNEDDELIGSQKIDCFRIKCYYDDKHDRIELFMSNGFDRFIYKICELLSIGRFTYGSNLEDIERCHEVYSKGFQSVYSLILTLEEFKLVDGFVASIDISGVSIDFKSFCTPIDSLKKCLCDDFERFDKRDEFYLRGEKLYKWD